ncbi:MAG: glycosyltransferase [gamma proteobacterium symbiont of Bathyaustriella thionipta]|nr:glycosyltransferase [gamma proteobacterium symbiont of Bathyaustriella thionipta]MCU7948675.1 glycosyltransferase [gamma proteobacterium symbiont of Bathyaustriella thionipta]MCU7952619.1 glycosyltransferase [gamma proteobacterium symbiont of Bathyaustriella thionipta]MCU7955116.1 glycosyltransferase [gamma proteobacterium symbiont of Bathyaustriella thionipta]MCU7968269.1 glycosyltransferase [gamma proteobacterium symbiont of Bathyaustriella thionipta]
MSSVNKKYVLQLCHDYTFPFLDVARQYASLFKGTEYKVITVYLVGEKNNDVVKQTDSDEVIFLEYPCKSLKGLKRKPIKQIKQLCSQYDFDFAIGHRYQAIYILRNIKHLPVIGVNHSFGKFKRFTRRWFVNRHKKNLYLLGVSNAIRDEMRVYLPRFPQQQIQTLYNRINPEQVRADQLDKEAARKHLGISQESYVFANVGRLHPDKDQRTLINAFAKAAPELPDAVLVIIGQGRLEKELKQQVQQLKLAHQVFFLGVVPEAVNYFRAFDSFILSSDYEPFGMVLLEAIMAEVPVISTNVGGAREIISNKQWLFDVGGVDKLAKLMLTMYAMDDAQKKALNEQNRQCLEENFTDDAVQNAFWHLPFVKSLRA